jgi:hypothetical protein
VPSAKTLEINQQMGALPRTKYYFTIKHGILTNKHADVAVKDSYLTINHGFSTNKHWDVPEEVGSLLSKIGDLIKAAKCTNHY